MGRIIAAILFAMTSAAAAAAPDEASLRAVDARQKMIVAAGDAAAMTALKHPNLLVNAPSNRVLGGTQVVAMMRSGEIAMESFERTPERVTVTGNVGVVMGNETLVPTATSESGRMFGAKRLTRRYTNVYLHDGKAWRFLARHANVVPPKP